MAVCNYNSSLVRITPWPPAGLGKRGSTAELYCSSNQFKILTAMEEIQLISGVAKEICGRLLFK